MDKNTLSHYGWIVVLILILSVMLALATPFGLFVARGFEATYVAFSLGGYDNLGNVIDEMGGNTAVVIPPPDVDDGDKNPDEGIDIKPDIKLIKIDKSENGRLLTPGIEVYFCEYELSDTIFNEAKEKNLCVLSVWKQSMVPSERNDCRRSRHVFKDTRQGSDGRRTL